MKNLNKVIRLPKKTVYLLLLTIVFIVLCTHYPSTTGGHESGIDSFEYHSSSKFINELGMESRYYNLASFLVFTKIQILREVLLSSRQFHCQQILR